MRYLRIRTLEKGKWYESYDWILHAAFQILVDFVEKQEPTKYIDWHADEFNSHAWSEIETLYHWWTQERPQRKDPADALEFSISPEWLLPINNFVEKAKTDPDFAEQLGKTGQISALHGLKRKTEPEEQESTDESEDSLDPDWLKSFDSYMEESESDPEVKEIWRRSEQLREQWEQQDQENLHRLIDIRNFLWC